MHHITIAGKDFPVTQTGKKFLSEYIARIESFLSENNMRESYLQDIEDRLVEKLSHAQGEGTVLKDADIISIVNEIGEPEDIFPTSTKETLYDTPRTEKRKILKRNKRDAILFGVCAGIADYFDVNPIWIRIFFIFLVVVGGTGILFYLFLALLLPVDTEKRPLAKSGPGFWEGLFSTTGTGIQRIFQAIVFLILSLLAFSIGMPFLFLFIASSIAVGVIIASPFEAANQIFPTGNSELLAFGLTLLAITALVTAIGLFALIFRRNFLGRIGWVATLSVFALSLMMSFGGFLSLVKNYTYEQKNVLEKNLKFSGNALYIDNALLREDEHKVPPFFFTNDVNVEYIEGKKDVSVKIEHIFHTQNPESGKKILDSFIAPEIALSGGVLTLSNPQRMDFTTRIPYAFPARHITVFVPAGTKVTGNTFSAPDAPISSEDVTGLEDENALLRDEIDALNDELSTLRDEKELQNTGTQNQ